MRPVHSTTTGRHWGIKKNIKAKETSIFRASERDYYFKNPKAGGWGNGAAHQLAKARKAAGKARKPDFLHFVLSLLLSAFWGEQNKRLKQSRDRAVRQGTHLGLSPSKPDNLITFYSCVLGSSFWPCKLPPIFPQDPGSCLLGLGPICILFFFTWLSRKGEQPQARIFLTWRRNHTASWFLLKKLAHGSELSTLISSTCAVKHMDSKQFHGDK